MSSSSGPGGDFDNDQAANTSSGSSSSGEVRRRDEASESVVERMDDEQSGNNEDIVIHPQVQEVAAYNNNFVNAEAAALAAAAIIPGLEEEDEIPDVDEDVDEARRLFVQNYVNEVWPLPAPFAGGNADDDDDDEGMDNVEDGYFEDEHDGSRNDESDDERARENSPDGPPPEFDPELPTRHAYLGNGMEELQGRIVFLDEGATPEIPLIVMGLQLVPGQTLPLTIFHAVFQNAIRRCVAGDRVFGIVHTEKQFLDYDYSLEGLPSGSMVFKGAFGTIAEIYEFQEEDPPSPDRVAAAGGLLPTTFSIKAKGRQRFNVLSFRRQADGNLMGVVKIRPEIRLSPLVQTIIFDNTHRYRFPIKTEDLAPALPPSIHIKKKTRTASESSDKTEDKEDNKEDNSDLIHMRKQILAKRKITKYYSAFTPFPYFVYEQFEEHCLVEKIHQKLRVELKGVTESGSIIPTDAEELSFWLALHLAMDDHHRVKVLQMDSPVQRLRYELDLLSKACKVITCRNCQTIIAESSDIFSMSIDGPQGTYVNPHGFVHETLTVHKVKEVLGRGFPSTESSWFPGYAWTIIECRRCSTHLGWKFTAVDRLTPKKFWGLCRKQVNFKYDFNSNSAQDFDQAMSNRGRTTPVSLPAAADFSLAM